MLPAPNQQYYQTGWTGVHVRNTTRKTLGQRCHQPNWQHGGGKDCECHLETKGQSNLQTRMKRGGTASSTSFSAFNLCTTLTHKFFLLYLRIIWVLFLLLSSCLCTIPISLILFALSIYFNTVLYLYVVVIFTIFSLGCSDASLNFFNISM